MTRDWSFETAVRTLWMEARGEPGDGQAAVAHVIWNRLHSGRWGNTLASVCLKRFQFSCWNTADPNREAMSVVPDADPLLARMRAVFGTAMGADDPTGGATYYFADTLLRRLHGKALAWTKGAAFCGKFGNQLFYRGVR